MMIAKAEAVQDYVVALRRDLHRNPELSGQEFKTRERLMKELDPRWWQGSIRAREAGP